MFDAWKDLAIGFGGLWLSLMSFVGVREIKRLDQKADREEVARLINLMERRDSDDRQARKEMYQKIDAAIAKQTEFNLQMARFMGRQ